ncbi:hypothetical protein FACS189499_06890 [Clostridia bacterium]|nr:hypothetical protein FACS189499_06890 [Clostridia bacterium]
MNKQDSRRVGLFDEIRGFAIICMVVYHAMFDLKNLYGFDVPIFFEDWFDIIRDIFAGMFIFISGAVCNYSRSNIKRGVQCFFLGMLMTFVTAFAAPDFPILFGILHFLGICMIIYGLAEDFFSGIPPFIGIILFGLLFAATFQLPSGFLGINGVFSWAVPGTVYDAGLLFPLGFSEPGFVSGDYFPLLPWSFLFFAGSSFGVIAAGNQLPQSFYRTRVRFFAATGRYTIWVYLLHQPLIMLLFTLLFGKS